MDTQTGGAKPRRPNGTFEGLGLFNLAATLALAGGAAGFVAHFIGQWFYLVLLFPVVIGLVVGGVGARMVKAYKVRSLLACGIAGLVAGGVAMAMVHNMNYLQVRTLGERFEPGELEFLTLRAEEQQEVISRQETDEAKLHLAELAAYGKETRGFFSSLDHAAEEGVVISRVVGIGEDVVRLGYVGSYLYWLVEILVVAGIVFLMLSKRLGEPAQQSVAASERVAA